LRRKKIKGEKKKKIRATPNQEQERSKGNLTTILSKPKPCSILGLKAREEEMAHQKGRETIKHD